MNPRRLSIFTLSLCLAHLAIAQPVAFNDANLKTAVESELGILNPTAVDMLGLIALNAESLGITDLTGLETATNLETLLLSDNGIRRLSPLSELTSLTDLRLSGNKIRDMSDLFGLLNLRVLHLADNQITNQFPTFGLSKLTDLEVLDLSGNQISDIFALADLPNLITLYLQGNPLNFDSHDEYIPTLQANGTTVFFDPPPAGFLPDVSTYEPWGVTATSATLEAGLVSDGGEPTEGRFRYWIAGRRYQTEQTTTWVYLDRIIFKATVYGLVPNTEYRYLGEVRNWTGDVLGDIRSFTTLDGVVVPPFGLVLYVDDDAPQDPGPSDPSISDPFENGSLAHPFDSVQEAIDVAPFHDGVIQVRTGRYYETLNLRGKALQLNGLDPDPVKRTALPVIDANGLGRAMTFAPSGGAISIITGFVLTGGVGESAGALASLDSGPVLEHCILVGNRFSDPSGGAIYLENSHGVFINCTIVDNVGTAGGAGVSLQNSHGVFLNCILWNQTAQEILGLSFPEVRYSTVAGGWPGVGNRDVHPIFAASGLWVQGDAGESFFIEGDYHLRSRTGRWDPLTETWVSDAVSSPAIDAGDPFAFWGNEPFPNGQRINQGAYGGTNQASQSP